MKNTQLDRIFLHQDPTAIKELYLSPMPEWFRGLTYNMLMKVYGYLKSRNISVEPSFESVWEYLNRNAEYLIGITSRGTFEDWFGMARGFGDAIKLRYEGARNNEVNQIAALYYLPQVIRDITTKY